MDINYIQHVRQVLSHYTTMAENAQPADLTEEALWLHIDDIMTSTLPRCRKLQLFVDIAPREPGIYEVSWYSMCLNTAWKKICPTGLPDIVNAPLELRYLAVARVFLYRRQWEARFADTPLSPDDAAMLLHEVTVLSGAQVDLVSADWAANLGNTLFGPAWTTLYLEPGMKLPDYYRVTWLERPPFLERTAPATSMVLPGDVMA